MTREEKIKSLIEDFNGMFVSSYKRELELKTDAEIDALFIKFYAPEKGGIFPSEDDAVYS